jgi:hypothetical protein
MRTPCATRSSVSFLFGLGTLIVLLAGSAWPTWAQVLVVSPDCGVPGQTTVTIKGSGWPEPDPPCEYVFFFNGTEVAPRQDDGLFGPPAASFTVPSVAPGKYRVRVELRITETQALRACREADFCVILQEADPWANAMTVVLGRTMQIEFDPTDVCDITPCKSIVLVQSINMKAYLNNDPPAEISFAQFRRADLQASRVNGITMDTFGRDRDPYYNGERDRSDRRLGSDGYKSCENSAISFMRDTPSVSDAWIPVNGTVIFEFEVNAFCARGDDRGDWLGQVTWTWSRAHGQAPVITQGTPNRNGPSSEFTAALTAWNSNPRHRFGLPTPRPPTSGGKPCQ